MPKFYFLTVFLSIISIASENKYNYDAKYFNLAKQINCDMGIVVIGYNRADSFKKVIESLEKNEEASYIPFIFVLDGGSNATQQEHIDVINASNIKHKFIYAHTTNYGCGRTLIDARRFMFEWCKFKKIFFFEDDMIVSSQYIALTLNLYNYAKKKYENIGVVQSYNRCFLSEKTKKLYSDYIIEPFGSCWGYFMDEDAYFAIADLMNEHEQKHLIAIPANQPNGPAIAKWIEDKIFCNSFLNRKNDHNDCSKLLKSKINWEEFCDYFIKRLKKSNVHRDGQDYEMRLALWKSGLLRLTTFVSRGLYIGEQGVHHHGSHHQQFAYDQLTLFESHNDDHLTQFKENFYIDLKEIVFDFSYCQNFGIARYVDRLVENGYSIKIYVNNKIDKLFFYHYLPSFVKNDFFKKNKKYIKITPIEDEKSLQTFLLNRLEDKHEYLYVIDEEMISFSQVYFEKLLDSKINFIAHAKKIKEALLKIFDPSKIVMWHETFKLFESKEYA